MTTIQQTPESDNPQFFQLALASLKRQTTAAIFDQLLKPLCVEKIADGVLYLSTAGNGIKMLETQWKRRILDAIADGEGVADIVFEAKHSQLLPADENTPDLLTPMRVRDRRKPRRYYVDNKFIRGGYAAIVGPYGLAVYSVLAMHADADDQNAWPSHATIAQLTGMSRRQSIRKVAELEALNVVQVMGRLKADGSQDSNVVVLIDCDDWKEIKL